MDGMFRWAHMAIRSSGREAPSRKLKAEREWSSINMAPGWRQDSFAICSLKFCDAQATVSRSGGWQIINAGLQMDQRKLPGMSQNDRLRPSTSNIVAACAG